MKRSRHPESFRADVGWTTFPILALACMLWAFPAWAAPPGWSTTGSLTTARTGHTSTILPDGKILVTGGYDGSDYLSSAEIYDPATGAWSSAGSMATARAGHTALVVPANKVVLVAGGYNSTDGTLSKVETFDYQLSEWGTYYPMNAGRAYHTATLLPDGKVLVAGGSDGSALSSAELYDPFLLAWSTVGPMGTARARHTATLLYNGKVLVAGGSDGGALSSAELYDPAAGTWSTAGSMGAARMNCTAARLVDGKVLVAGGSDAGGSLSSSELYDPGAGTWSPTGSMGAARKFHSATMLSDGKVLVAGGEGSQGTLSSAEVYQPASGTWSATAPMPSAHSEHTATFILSNGNVLVSGGTAGGVTLSLAALYIPSKGTWSTAPDMGTPRYFHTATPLADGKVLVAGGYNYPGPPSYLVSTERYDPVAGTWSATGPMGVGREMHTATLLPDGKVLIAGGAAPYPDNTTSGAELFDPSTGLFSSTGSMGTPRQFHTATLLKNGKVLVTGGVRYNTPMDNVWFTAELYDPATGTWSDTGSMGYARAAHTMTLLPDGKVLVAGLWGNGDPRSAEVYDPATGQFSFTGSMVNARTDASGSHTATLLGNGKVLFAGAAGCYGRAYGAELYDPGTGTFTLTGPMGSCRSNHQAVLLPNGTVLVMGGTPADPPFAAEIYNPATDEWSAASPMGIERFWHTATGLPNGKVLVAGGYDYNNPSFPLLSSAELYVPARGAQVTGDFDGDGKTDFGVWRPTDRNGTWYVKLSSGAKDLLQQFGDHPSGDIPVPGDYDGDGKIDYAVWRPKQAGQTDAHWYVWLSSTSAQVWKKFGDDALGDIPVPGDYDGDGKTDYAVWRPKQAGETDAHWYVWLSTNTAQVSKAFGDDAEGDVPVPGDYDGDGKADCAVWRASSGKWFVMPSSGAPQRQQKFGDSTLGDVPVPGDYDGDGKTDYAVWRPKQAGETEAHWYVWRSSTDSAQPAKGFGDDTLGDVPVPGDYDGDGKTDFAVWRPSDGKWYVMFSGGGSSATQWGDQPSGDNPVNRPVHLWGTP